MVIGTAGTTAAGVIDPLPEIAKFCREQKLWFHADAAYGGAAVISPALQPHLAGIESADSITCDAHKWLSVPMGCGMFFTRHRESVAQAFRSDVTYMPSKVPAGEVGYVQSAHALGAMVAPLYRPQAFYGSCRNWVRPDTRKCLSTRRAWPMCCATPSPRPAGAFAIRRRCPSFALRAMG